jgi:predicted ester cyclase
MPMTLQCFGPVNQIQHEECITIVKNPEFFKIFPDNHLINNPYKILIAEGDYTCSVADFTGTFKGPMKGPDRNMIQPTNKKFHLEFCTVAHWKDGKILEERLFYDQMGMLKQIGAIQ